MEIIYCILFIILFTIVTYFSFKIMFMLNSDLFYEIYVHESFAFRNFKKICPRELRYAPKYELVKRIELAIKRLENCNSFFALELLEILKGSK